MSSTETCPKCKKPTSGGSGSITQWIAVCKCNDLDSDKQINQKPEPEQTVICRTCGKHIGGGRSGSFTQYIFRHDLCKCEQPEPEKVANPSTIQKSQTTKVGGTRATETELSLSEPEKFPLQRYKPLSLLGRGAAGSVYLCRDRLLGKKVAVKTLNKLSTDQLVSFQLEAKAASRIKHPYITMALDFGATESGCPYLVMEYVDGKSLAQLLEERGTLDTDLATSIGIKICDALEYVHQHKMFHRDLKPSNILFVQHNSSADFDIKLIDFGVAQAKFDTQEPTIFQGKTVVGTPNYMSPDQVRGKSYDARSEVYTFGCVLFELLVGSPPFVSNSALEVISMHAHEAPRALSDFVAEGEFPERLETVVSKCLEKEPIDRYQSMAEVKSELAMVSDSDLIVSANTPISEEKPKNKQSIPGYFKVLVGILSLAIIAIFWIVATDQPQQTITTKPIKVETYKDPYAIAGVDPEDKLAGPFTGKLMANVDFADDDMKSILIFKNRVNRLVLAGSQVTGKNFSILKGLPLEGLDLSRTNINDQSLVEIGKIRNLEVLILDYTPISDEGVRHLSSLAKLKYLDMENTRVSDSGLAVISRFPALISLDLNGCNNLTGAGLLKLARSRSLQRISIADCPRILSKAKDLKKFGKLNNHCAVILTSSKIAFMSTRLSRKYTAANPDFKKFLKYGGEMYDKEFRTFFRNPENWKLNQSEIAKIKIR
jgi:Serine/threonine protein kinase